MAQYLSALCSYISHNVRLCVCLPGCLAVYLYIYLCVCLSVCLPIYLFVSITYLFVCLHIAYVCIRIMPVCLHTCSLIWHLTMPFSLSICSFAYQHVCLSVYLSISLSVCLSACLTACLSLSLSLSLSHSLALSLARSLSPPSPSLSLIIIYLNTDTLCFNHARVRITHNWRPDEK